MTVGVVALQGDFMKHIEALERLREPGLEILEVRTPEDLAQVERVILPGGESTTVGLLMQRFGLGPALQSAVAGGMPIWGTCMGMIMMARAVSGRPQQYTLNLLDIEVTRNAFGAQVHSFEDAVPIVGLSEPVLGVFIRAPVVSHIGVHVNVIGNYDKQIVAVRQGNRIGTSFHPELTDDTRFHRYFVGL